MLDFFEYEGKDFWAAQVHPTIALQPHEEDSLSLAQAERQRCYLLQIWATEKGTGQAGTWKE